MIVVAGTFRIPPEKIEDWLPHARTMLAATRAEAGCIAYSYAFDVEDHGLVRVYEEWEARAALEAHFAAPHLKKWRDALAEIGAFERRLEMFEAGDSEPL